MCRQWCMLQGALQAYCRVACVLNHGLYSLGARLSRAPSGSGAVRWMARCTSDDDDDSDDDGGSVVSVCWLVTCVAKARDGRAWRSIAVVCRSRCSL